MKNAKTHIIESMFPENIQRILNLTIGFILISRIVNPLQQ